MKNVLPEVSHKLPLAILPHLLVFEFTYGTQLVQHCKQRNIISNNCRAHLALRIQNMLATFTLGHLRLADSQTLLYSTSLKLHIGNQNQLGIQIPANRIL